MWELPPSVAASPVLYPQAERRLAMFDAIRAAGALVPQGSHFGPRQKTERSVAHFSPGSRLQRRALLVGIAPDGGVTRGNDAHAFRDAPPSVPTNAAVDRLTRVASLCQLARRRGCSVLRRVTPSAAHSTPTPAYAMTPKTRKPPKLSEASSGTSTTARAAK